MRAIMGTASLVIGLVTLVAAMGAAASQTTPVEVKSSLAGIVLADRLVKAGDAVEDAQPLVYVRTVLTGTVGVAARAPRAGVVRDVLVRPDQPVERGDVVVRLDPR